MSYTRGSTYIWSDGDHLHLWVDDGLDHWKSTERYQSLPQASGVQIAERVADEFAVMRFAELVQAGDGSRVIDEALRQWAGNGGCQALKELAPALKKSCGS